MRLKDYLKELDQPQASGSNPLDDYAQRVGTSAKYLRTHVMGASRGASLKFMRALSRESNRQVTLLDVLRHYGVPESELKD